MSYKFGVAGSFTNGLWQNVTENEVSDQAEARDENGQVRQNDIYNPHKEFSGELLLDTQATAPKAGDTVTYNSTTYTLINVSKVESNTDYTKYSVSGTSYPSTYHSSSSVAASV